MVPFSLLNQTGETNMAAATAQKKTARKAVRLSPSLAARRRAEEGKNIDDLRITTHANLLILGLLDVNRRKPDFSHLNTQFLMGDARSFNSVYTRIQEDYPKALDTLTLLLGSHVSDKQWDTLLSPTNLKKLNKYALLYLTTHFPQQTKRESVIHRLFLAEILEYEFSTTSLLGQDDYSSFKDLANKLDQISYNDLPREFNKSLILTLFEPEGALEWSVDAASRRQAIDCVMPLYRSSTVRDIFDHELNAKEKKKCANNLVSLCNIASEMVAKNDMSLSLHKHILQHLSEIAQLFDLSKSQIQERLFNHYAENKNNYRVGQKKLEQLDEQIIQYWGL